MANKENSLLSSKPLNGWNLLGWISLVITLLVVYAFVAINTKNPADISAMITHSVRLAVPWLYIAFAASSLVILWPGAFTKWILKNRKFFGLCFAVGMAWQLFFILWFVIGSFDYYMAQSYAFHSLVEQVPGYLVLFAMIFTSFKFGRKMISGNKWRLLHKGGIYWLWGVLYSAYWYELYYYDDIQFIDQVYYWMGISAWLVRIAAWGKKRGANKKFKLASGSQSPLPVHNIIIACSLTAVGIIMIVNGQLWAPLALRIIPYLYLGAWLEHLTAFLPLIPLYFAASLASMRRQIK